MWGSISRAFLRREREAGFGVNGEKGAYVMDVSFASVSIRTRTELYSLGCGRRITNSVAIH